VGKARNIALAAAVVTSWSGAVSATASAAPGNLYATFSGGSCSGSIALTLKDGWVYPSATGRCSKPNIGRGVFAEVIRPNGEVYWYLYEDFVNNTARATAPRFVVEPGAYRMCGYVRRVNRNDNVTGVCATRTLK
jgi:hypothetical protein